MKKFFLLLIFSATLFGEEIFVSITKEGLSKNFTPLNSTVITKQQIKNTTAKNLGELLENVTPYEFGNYGTLGSAKNIRVRNSTSEQVLILINGVPLNVSGKSGINLSLIPVESIDKIEIITDNCSALYGPNAVGGIVNIITSSPKEEKPTTDINFSYGSFDTIVAGAGIDYDSSRYGIALKVTNKHSAGWRENSDYDSLEGYTNFNLPILKGKINLTFLNHSSKLGVPGPTMVAMSNWDGEIEKKASSPYARQNDDFNFITISYDDKVISSKINFTYQGLVYDDTKNLLWPSKTESDYNTLNFLNTIALPNKIFISANYSYTSIDQRYPLLVTNNFNKSNSNIGLAIQKEFKKESLIFIPTVRWDANSLFGDEISPQAVVVYNIQQTKLSLSLGSSWRAPTFLDLYWPDDGWTKGNDKLEPEESYSIDFSVAQNFGMLEVVVNPFYRYVKKQIRWYPDSLTYIWMPSNVDETVAQGVELKAEILPCEWCENKISVLVSDNKIKKKGEETLGWQQQAYSPLVCLSYYSEMKIFLGLELVNLVKYTSEQYSLDNEKGIKLKDFVMWDLKMTKKVGLVEVYAQVNDLLDQKGVNRAGYPQPGRNYEGGVKVNLKI